MMERVLYNLHSQVCSTALQRTSSRTRSLVEHTILLVALCGFGVLIVSHISFVYRSSRNSIPYQCLRSIPGFSADREVTHVLLLPPNQDSFAYTPTSSDSWQTCVSKDVCTTLPKDNYDDRIVLSYSSNKGFLFLSPQVCLEHSVSTQYVYVSTTQFGKEVFLQRLFYILGPDTVVLNWLVAIYGSQGFIHYPKQSAVLDLETFKAGHTYRHALVYKAGVVVTSIFLFFITTTLVRFTLQETQERMLHFTFSLQEHVRSNLYLGRLIFTHVVENLVFVPIMVGVMFFLIEFYGGDKFLAFMVFSIVWVYEAFSLVAIRSIQGMQFFPKIFFLLFTLFHVYYFSCPFGFSYLALASTALFVLHSMLFFWHRYELPAFCYGLVTVEHPRMANNPPLEATEAARAHPSTSTFAPSSTGLFHEGDNDDEDGSYMYFMGGEVVMHRERNVRAARSPSISTQGSMDEAGRPPMVVNLPPRTTTRSPPLATTSAAARVDEREVDDDPDRTPLIGSTTSHHVVVSSSTEVPHFPSFQGDDE